MRKIYQFPNVQVHKICAPNDTLCSSEMKIDLFGCRVSCTGLFADVSYSKGNPEDRSVASEDMILDTEVFSKLTQDYKTFKSKFAQNLIFNSTSPSLGGRIKYSFLLIFSCPFSSLMYSPITDQDNRQISNRNSLSLLSH